MSIGIDKLRCGECGKRKLKLSNVKNKSFSYKEFRKVKIIVDCFIPECENCSNTIDLGQEIP